MSGMLSQAPPAGVPDAGAADIAHTPSMQQGMPPGPQGIPPGAQPNPAFQQWMQAFQKQQQVVAENAKRQAEFDAACNLIRQDGVRGFKLDIEADSTVEPDEQAEKQARTEFLREIVPLISQLTPIAQGNPQMADLVSEICMFVVRGFRVARTLEDAFEKAFKVLGQMPAPAPKGGAQGKQVDPQLEQAKLLADVHDTQTRAQTDQAIAASKAQTDQMAIAQKAQQAVLQYQAAQERGAQEDQNNQARIAMDAMKLRTQERLAMQRSAQKAAGSLE